MQRGWPVAVGDLVGKTMAHDSKSEQPASPAAEESDGSPNGGSSLRGCLVVARGKRLGSQIDLDALPLTIGRGSAADFRIPSRMVSRVHCRIFDQDGELWIEDLDSTNKTRVNGETIARHKLSDGDQIRIGDSVLEYLGPTGTLMAGFLAELREQAVRDELTGLYNRRYLMDVVADKIGDCRHGFERSLALALIDLDRFKDVNERMGHVAGDGVLRQLGAILRAGVREEDTLARIGGEEFALVMPGVPSETAALVCNRLCRAIADQRFIIEGTAKSVAVTASIGVALWSANMKSADELVRAAERFLHEAKRDGRDQVGGPG